ncbi:uncharacterized protein LOC111366682 [Olea europaea var. sylvestris]|uniref:uncharacterized protein LOC111366682 n=1 Tax=Olea europaea var. sylvestris TaxID=158386 RepID=UPI000C1CD09F|nr:uncharacterized protein LOC111366682 [Olea europaea var. sylvestris]
MYTNFFNLGFKGKTLKDLLWRAAKSTALVDHRQWIQQILQLSEGAHKWLTERPAAKWSKSHFKTQLKSDILLNNLCKVFNKMLIDDRKKLIITMSTDLQLAFMVRIEKRQRKMMRYGGQLCSRIKKKLVKITEMANECTLHFSGRPRWQVDCKYRTYVIDLEEQSCACRRWELTGIPCSHAIAVIRETRNEIEDFVDNYYTADTYLRCYDHIMNPINGRRLWPRLDTLPIFPLLWNTPQRGRKQNKRRKQAEEDVIECSHGRSHVRKKGMVSMTCSIYGLKGHNKRYHSRFDAPFNGKLVPDRGYGAGLSQPHKEFQSFQFMPTPSIGNQHQTIFQDEVPAASIPFSEIGPSSHT